MTLESKKIKSVTVSIVSPSMCHEVMGPDAIIFIFWMLSFKPAFFTLLFHFHEEAPQFSLSAIRVVLSAYLRLLIFLPAIICIYKINTFLLAIIYIIMNQCKCYVSKDLCEIIIDHRRPDLEAFLMANWVKNTPAMQETQESWGFYPWVGKIPWRRKWQPTPVLLPGKPWMKEPGRLQFMGSQTVWQDWATSLSCRWHHRYGRKWRNKEPLDESERGEWKSRLKMQHSEN